MSFPPPAVTQENWTITKNDSQLEEDPLTQVILNTAGLLVCIFELVGNGMVAFFLGFRLKKTNFTIYILNLTLADFMFLACSSLLIVHITVFTVHPQSFVQHLDADIVLKLVFAIMIACLFGYNTSLYLLTAISMERCLSVLFPIWYQCRRPKHQSAVVCSLLWMLSCLVTTAECYACDRNMYIYQNQEFSNTYGTSCHTVYVFIGLSFLVFAPLMVLSSVILLIKVKRDSRKQQPSKLYIVIVATVVLFLTFAIPLRVILQVGYKSHTFLPLVVVSVSSLLCCVNSSVNPFVYWFVGRWGDGKGSFQMILQRIFREDIKEHKKQCSLGMTGRQWKETVI